jgi:hypothetical protein
METGKVKQKIIRFYQDEANPTNRVSTGNRGFAKQKSKFFHACLFKS